MQAAARLIARAALVIAAGAALPAPAAEVFNPSPHAIDVPQWFKPSFLDVREDVAEAARDGKRLILYFGQDGCPYCRELMRVSFSEKAIVDKMRRHFDAVALNIWGDREVTGLDRKRYSEKAYAAFMKIQFTPTLLFFDEQGNVALRLNGYYPPHKFAAALDYVAGKHETREPFAAFLARHAREPASGKLHDQAFFMKPPYDLARTRKAGARPLAVFFEQRDCAACDELHGKGFTDAGLKALLPGFDLVRLELFGNAPLYTPSGARVTESAWARELRIAYTPSVVFFDAAGREVFRLEGYLRAFHLASSFDYVGSGAYRREPSFQRFIQSRAEALRKAGKKVELW